MSMMMMSRRSRKIFTIIKKHNHGCPSSRQLQGRGFWRLRVNSAPKSCSNYLKVFEDRNISCLRMRTVQLQNTGDQEEQDFSSGSGGRHGGHHARHYGGQYRGGPELDSSPGSLLLIHKLITSHTLPAQNWPNFKMERFQDGEIQIDSYRPFLINYNCSVSSLPRSRSK